MKLIIKLLLGIVAGLLIGLFAPEGVVRLLVTIQTVIGAFIVFLIPFIILFFIAHGISSLPHSSGRLLGLTIVSAYVSTIVATLIACSIALILLPTLLNGIDPESVNVQAKEIMPFIEFRVEPVMGVITALLTAFLFGIGIQLTASSVKTTALKDMVAQGKLIVEIAIRKVVIPLLPFYIAGIFTDLAANGTAFVYLYTFAKVLVLVIVLHWLWILVLYAIAAMVSGRNMFSLIKVMLPAYVTAIGTMSSAATIPVTLRQAQKNKISEPTREFVIPLCASIHLSGSSITIITCAVAVMLLSPSLPTPGLLMLIPFILTLGVITIAAPGVPGGTILAALGILASILGFDEATLALMIALFLAQDSFGTACNILGDGAIAIIVDAEAGNNAEIVDKA
ncbi:cation:dicarboxylase symporter family transporter [Haliea sp. AH-315-K21]|uniref:Dicarboxylate/amino acid:cation symporter n=1 Tax=SAR86 cluster bacterium TaxID=2030880 RepID=A0A2A5C8T3_9GAMM|nr:cation:dicarboxylase symporter family transporter [Haliea sp. AH-315-K21]PCJ40232.1 MAG: dicarboxylate/amino acid:cation symporter [SAR86 cluster bacterium]